MTARLPAHLEIAGLIRAAEAAGGFAAVLQRGEKDGGVILILTIERGGNSRLWERMPNIDGTRSFVVTKEQVPDKKQEFEDYLERRMDQDPDSWLLELDVADSTQLIADWGC